MRIGSAVLAGAVSVLAAGLQPLAAETARWTRAGGTGVDAGLAGPAGRPVEGAWFSADGRRLYAALAGGSVWVSEDLGATWTESERNPLEPIASLEPASGGGRSPVVLRNPYRAGVAYALGEHLFRSDDGGREWTNLTRVGGRSVIGRWQSVLAVSPTEPSTIVVGNARGLWKSYDAGVTWASLNATLPNFPSARFRSVAAPARLALESDSLGSLELARTSGGSRWQAVPGRGGPWADLHPADRARVARPAPLTPPGYAASHRVWRNGEPVSGDLTGCDGAADCARRSIVALEANGRLWAGTSDGRIWVSGDEGVTWELSWSDPDERSVASLWADPGNPRAALAVAGGRVLRTTNGGTTWFDISSNLPDHAWTSVTAHSEGRIAYVGGPQGIYSSRVDLGEPGPAGDWAPVAGDLGASAVRDLALDPLHGRLYASLPGRGVYWLRVPQVTGALRALSAADLSPRPAAPGGLLTILGADALQARADGLPAPILHAGRGRTQLQIPFAAEGRSVRLRLDGTHASHVLEMPLDVVSPAIFVAAGEPLLLDSATGAMIGWDRPARVGGSVLVMAAGLGAVAPAWPTGLPAPESDPPRPVARIAASLDGVPVEVVSARLAAGYVGVYVIEVAIPAGALPGRASLAISAAGRPSDPVRVVIGR